MFDNFAEDLALKAKAHTGMSSELMAWCGIAVFLAAIGVVFLSVAGYFWLTVYFTEAAAAGLVASANIVIAAVAVARVIVLRRRNAARALAKLKEAERRAPWWSDPAVITVGYEIAKIVGWRKLTPLVAAGVLAATTLGRKTGQRHTGTGTNTGNSSQPPA